MERGLILCHAIRAVHPMSRERYEEPDLDELLQLAAPGGSGLSAGGSLSARRAHSHASSQALGQDSAMLMRPVTTGGAMGSARALPWPFALDSSVQPVESGGFAAGAAAAFAAGGGDAFADDVAEDDYSQRSRRSAAQQQRSASLDLPRVGTPRELSALTAQSNERLARCVHSVAVRCCALAVRCVTDCSARSRRCMHATCAPHRSICEV
jgi:hypothetical protein